MGGWELGVGGSPDRRTIETMSLNIRTTLLGATSVLLAWNA